MDDNLKLFENPDFGDVRVLLDEKHEPWFVGNDVAKCLGYADPRDAVRRLVDDEDCKMLRLSEDREAYDSTPIHNQYVSQIKIINESGMYTLIMSSKKEFAKTAEIAQETDMLIREVREKLEAHGYDIAEKNLRILLEDKKFFAKTGKRWLLSQRMIDSGYARYRYRNDDEFYGTNTVYVTPKGFQWIVSKISKEWMPRFLELKGRVLSRSDKDIFAKR